jgi:hypothetical protein
LARFTLPQSILLLRPDPCSYIDRASHLKSPHIGRDVGWRDPSGDIERSCTQSRLVCGIRSVHDACSGQTACVPDGRFVTGVCAKSIRIKPAGRLTNLRQEKSSPWHRSDHWGWVCSSRMLYFCFLRVWSKATGSRYVSIKVRSSLTPCDQGFLTAEKLIPTRDHDMHYGCSTEVRRYCTDFSVVYL